MYLFWTDHDGRECAANFKIEAEAQACATLVRARVGVQDVQLVDEDGLPLTTHKENRS
jgi:hypothetical protein